MVYIKNYKTLSFLVKYFFYFSHKRLKKSGTLGKNKNAGRFLFYEASETGMPGFYLAAIKAADFINASNAARVGRPSLSPSLCIWMEQIALPCIKSA